MTQPTISVEPRRTGRSDRIAHAEDPSRPGFGLCGTKLAGTPTSPAAQRCAVCLDLTRRTFFGR